MRDDLLIGTEHSYKILPECSTPQNNFLSRKSFTDISDEEKNKLL